MNFAGLPEILQNNEAPGDKTTNSRTIGSYFAQYIYGIINVQEKNRPLWRTQNFNYHAYIYEIDTHPYRTATSGGVPFDSGLNTLSNYDWIDFERVKWGTCSKASGSKASGADCLTPKDFTFMRARIAGGAFYVDVKPNQVSDYINAWSVGNAVLVLGDTDSRYTRTSDRIGVFDSQNGMTADVWLQLERDDGVVPTEETICANPSTTNYRETVDKVFCRGSYDPDARRLGILDGREAVLGPRRAARRATSSSKPPPARARHTVGGHIDL